MTKASKEFFTERFNKGNGFAKISAGSQVLYACLQLIKVLNFLIYYLKLLINNH